jgi:hypothetical protein
MTRENARPELTAENTEKIQRLAHELNVSQAEALNRILNAITTIDMKQIITFVMEVRVDPSQPGKKVAMRRQQNWKINI